MSDISKGIITMSTKFENICSTVRNYLDSNGINYHECDVQNGINIYTNRGSQSVTLSIFYTGSIKIGFKKNSTQLKDDLLKLKEDIQNGKL